MVYPVLDAAAVLPEHRSINSRIPTAVAFENATQRRVEVIWLSYQGDAHHYHTLLPGASTVQLTFTTHPWVFRDPSDPSAVLVVGNQAVFYAPPLHARGSGYPRVVIREADRQPWSPAHHLLAPPAFQQQAAALLLCHQRLARGGVSPQDRDAQEGEAREGWPMQLRSAVSRPCQQPGAELGREVQQEEQAGSEEAAVLLPAPQHQLGLGDLPQDLLLMVLTAAAPPVPLLVKPALPQGLSPAELPHAALEHLFRAGPCTGAGGSRSRGSTSVDGGAGLWQAARREEQERSMPAKQLWQLRAQQEDPQPPPLAPEPHPLLGNQPIFAAGLLQLVAGADPNPLPAEPGNGAADGQQPA